MALINLTGVQPVQYTVLTDEAQPSEGETVLVSLDRLANENEDFFHAVGSVGALIDTEKTFSALEPFANKIAFVAIDFPAFGDGRGFSLAVRLRKDFGFKGEIRAVGNVIPDQALFLLRAGFDTVEATEERIAAFEAALSRFSAFYQTDIGGQLSVGHARHLSEGQRKAS